MSLTSHLKDATSPIGQYIKQRFAQTKSITKAPNAQLKNATTIRNASMDRSYPYSVIGAAIDYRIRYAFGITPYQQFVAWKGATMLAFKAWESDDDIVVEDWYKYTGIPFYFDVSQGVAEGPYPLSFLRTFFHSLDVLVDAIQPVGKRLILNDELLLDRYCYVLSLFEQVFRSGVTTAYQHSPLMIPAPIQDIDALLAIPQAACTEDMAAIFALFYERYSHLLAKPHILNPKFAGSGDIGGADADLIVDGCLIDIKTSISSSLPAEHLHQLAGYLLLDYDDRLHINSVGIYMARQGMLFTWPVPEFVHQLTGDDSVTLSSLRKEFRAKF